MIDILWHYIGGDSLEIELKENIEQAIKSLRLYANKALNDDKAMLLNNLRIIEKLADSIKIDFIGQKKYFDIDCIDFIHLQLIRLNCFPLYEVLKNNKAVWVGEKGEEPTNNSENESGSSSVRDILVDAALAEIKDDKRKAVLKKLTKLMFPIYRDLDDIFYFRETLNKYPICKEDYFDRYFVEGLPQGQVSIQKIKELVDHWGRNVPIKDSLSEMTDLDIAWLFRELATVKPVELDLEIIKAIQKYLIDQKIDHGISYTTSGFVAEPDDFAVNNAESYFSVVKYYLSKSEIVDASFYAACHYFNKLYWRVRRRGIEGLKLDDVDRLFILLRREFKSRFLSKKLDLFSFDEKQLHFYWYIFTRDDKKMERELTKYLARRVEASAQNFIQYVYFYREKCRSSEDPNWPSQYRSSAVFTDKNISLAKQHLNNPRLPNPDIEELNSFIEIAQEHKQKAQKKGKSG